jgi:hypothetical protein
MRAGRVGCRDRELGLALGASGQICRLRTRNQTLPRGQGGCTGLLSGVGMSNSVMTGRRDAAHPIAEVSENQKPPHLP